MHIFCTACKSIFNTARAPSNIIMQRGVRAASTVRTTARTADKVHFSILNAKLRAPCLFVTRSGVLARRST